MRRLARFPVWSWLLGAVTLAVLFSHVPDTGDLDAFIWLFYAALVALMLNLGTRFNEGVLSPASTAALMAYLTLGGDQPAGSAVWCVTVGALVGNVVWLVRTLPPRPMRRQYGRVLRNITVGIAQMTLGLQAGSWAYRLLGGTLPLGQLDWRDVVPLMGLVFVYVAVDLGILFGEARHMPHRSLRGVLERQNSPGIVLLPLPFAVVGALAYHTLSHLAFFILIGGLLTVVTEVMLLNRAQARDRQQVRELSALAAISHAMRTNTDLVALLGTVYEQVAQLLDVDHFTVALLDPVGDTLSFPVNVEAGRLVPCAGRPLAGELIDAVIRQQYPLLLSDQVAHRAEIMGLSAPPGPVYSWLGVPLLVPDRVLGGMQVYSTRRDQQFTPADVQLLSTVAGQVGIAVENAQLYATAHHRAARLATLNNASALLSGTLDVQQVLDQVIASAEGVGSYDGIALYMAQGESSQAPAVVRQMGFSAGFARHPIAPLVLDLADPRERCQPLIIADTHQDRRANGVRAALDREGKRAWAEFPVGKADDLLGVLVFAYVQPHSFDSEEVELLRNFSAQVALAIRNARLYTRTDETLSRRVEQLSALADVSRELTSLLGLPHVVQLVLDRALAATRSQAGLLLLRQGGDALPRVVAARGFDADALAAVDPLVGSIAQAYETGSPSVTEAAGELSQFLRLPEVPPARLNVPIHREGDVLGVISLWGSGPGAYTVDDLAFVTQLATQARMAIDNARLFRSIEIARDRLQVILDSMKEGVLLLGAGGEIVLANPRIERLLGLDLARIVGRSVSELVGDPALMLAQRLGFRDEMLLRVTQELMERQWDDSSHYGARVTYEVFASRRRFIDRTCAPVRDETGQAIGVLMVFSDVTEERELSQSREDLGSMIVHDLRGPLTAITTSLKLLAEVAPPGDPLGKTITQTTDTALRAVRKLLNLVDSLLDVSKMESGVITVEREPTDIWPLCQAVIEELSPLAREMDIELVLDLSDQLPLLEVDASKIERVFLNLVDNAIKFTPAGGRVVIRTCGPGAPETGERFVRVDVCDTGPGVPDEHKERLFDRFTQIKEQRGRRRGTGLGLTFCRLTVEAHGGRIWVEDNPGGGAIFAFTLPLVDLSLWEPDA